MDACDVLIVGGGPAGSTCARQLRQGGLDVLLLDKARFPRDKVCAGWITPPAVAALALDVADYSRNRTFQTFTGFRIGVIGSDITTDVDYDEPVSYGIRRCEFDDYLLRRAGARLQLGSAVRTIERRDDGWIVNGAVTARMLVGAGGHTCPVARWLNRSTASPPIVHAQEVEWPLAAGTRCAIDPKRPELFFSHDMSGYGWCIRKGDCVNVGFGRLNAQRLAGDTRDFVAFLNERGRISGVDPSRWRAHAYLLAADRHRQVIADGLLLIGDAAGLALPPSGEGIRPAIESGILAASVIISAQRRYTAERLRPYEHEVHRQSGVGAVAEALWRVVPTPVRDATVRRLIARPWFARHIVLDRWFLQRRNPGVRAGIPHASGRNRITRAGGSPCASATDVTPGASWPHA
jgi:geranylgeranyl reductase family protein